MSISDCSSDVASSDLADAQICDRGQQCLAEAIGSLVAHEHDHRERHATLARTAESGAGKIVHDGIEIGVGHDNAVVLGATHRLHALAACGSAAIDVMRDIETADRKSTHRNSIN